MRDWTIRWVSVVVVIWVYSSSLALSSKSLWLAARYWGFSARVPKSISSSPTVTATSNRRVTMSSGGIDMLYSRGGGSGGVRDDDDGEQNQVLPLDDHMIPPTLQDMDDNEQESHPHQQTPVSSDHGNSFVDKGDEELVVLASSTVHNSHDDNTIHHIQHPNESQDNVRSTSSTLATTKKMASLLQDLKERWSTTTTTTTTSRNNGNRFGKPVDNSNGKRTQQPREYVLSLIKQPHSKKEPQQPDYKNQSTTSSMMRLSTKFRIRRRGAGTSGMERWTMLKRKRENFVMRNNQTVAGSPTILNERQLSFLDHILMVSTAFWNRETEALLENETAANATNSSALSRLLWSSRHRRSRRGNVTTTLDKSIPSSQLHDDDDENDYDTIMEDPKNKDTWITAQSDLTLPGRHITIVTTAALPWMTGTAVNPLLRAAHLCRRTRLINYGPHNNHTLVVKNAQDDDHNNNNNDPSASHHHQHRQWVTLVIPWLELSEDQQELYQRVFQSPQEQEDYIRHWLRHDADLADVADPETGLKIIFYPARYHSGMRSVFAMGDICSLIPNDEADVCILEEPEHCNWFRAPGDGWTRKFHYVVGVVHTNYLQYASAQYHGLWTAPALSLISSAMVRAYCHKVIKLSDVLQTFAPEKEATSNVHGVRSDFLDEGIRRANCAMEQKAHENINVTTTSTNDHPITDVGGGIYFIGKILWAKGLDLLLDLEDYYKQYTGDYFPIDIYGSGPDQKEIMRAYLGRRRRQAKVKQQHNLNGRTRKFLPWHHRFRIRKVSPSITDSGEVEASQQLVRPASTSNQEALSLQIIGKTISLEGGTSGNTGLSTAEEQFLNESLSDDTEAVDTWFASFSSGSTTLRDLLSQRAKERLAKIKETIRTTTESIEIPRTLHELRRQPIPATFPGRVDHSLLKEKYKIFVNPSISEVLCTTTAEALAMGKFAIIPVHPSNAFFYKFPNCLAYRNKLEFVANLRWALTNEPEPLTPELAREFSWEAATERLIDASAITWKEAREREKLGLAKLDERIAWFHNELGKGTKGDILRKVMGAGPASHQVKYQTLMQQQSQQQLLLLTKAELEQFNGQGYNSRHREATTTISADDGLEDALDDSDNDEEGLTGKFRGSSFVRAIRTTIANGLPYWNTPP